MKREWALQDAKNKLSEVVFLSEKESQIITKRGEKTAVVVSYKKWKQLMLRQKKHQGSLVDFFRSSPLSVVDLTEKRVALPSRDHF